MWVRRWRERERERSGVANRHHFFLSLFIGCHNSTQITSPYFIFSSTFLSCFSSQKAKTKGKIIIWEPFWPGLGHNSPYKKILSFGFFIFCFLYDKFSHLLPKLNYHIQFLGSSGGQWHVALWWLALWQKNIQVIKTDGGKLYFKKQKKKLC